MLTAKPGARSCKPARLVSAKFTKPAALSVIDNYKDNASFIAAVQKWQKEYAFEDSAFWKIEGVQKGNPSAYYLGLSDGKKPAVFQSSIWEWVHNSKISDN